MELQQVDIPLEPADIESRAPIPHFIHKEEKAWRTAHGRKFNNGQRREAGARIRAHIEAVAGRRSGLTNAELREVAQRITDDPMLCCRFTDLHLIVSDPPAPEPEPVPAPQPRRTRFRQMFAKKALPGE